MGTRAAKGRFLGVERRETKTLGNERKKEKIGGKDITEGGGKDRDRK